MDPPIEVVERYMIIRVDVVVRIGRRAANLCRKSVNVACIQNRIVVEVTWQNGARRDMFVRDLHKTEDCVAQLIACLKRIVRDTHLSRQESAIRRGDERLRGHRLIGRPSQRLSRSPNTSNCITISSSKGCRFVLMLARSRAAPEGAM